jgi:hypothetical protein
VPVEEDTWDESVEGLPAKADEESEGQATRFEAGDGFSCGSRVQRTDCECCCGWGGEDEALADDKVGAEGDDEEHAKVGTSNRQRDEPITSYQYDYFVEK